MDNVQRVIKVVAEQLGVNEADIKNESSFVGDLGADSLDTVELVMALEEEFGAKSLTKTQKRSPPSSRRSTTSTAIRADLSLSDWFGRFVAPDRLSAVSNVF